jgi:hypothetical protein
MDDSIADRNQQWLQLIDAGHHRQSAGRPVRRRHDDSAFA